jgi:hypothetical protein
MLAAPLSNEGNDGVTPPAPPAAPSLVQRAACWTLLACGVAAATAPPVAAALVVAAAGCSHAATRHAPRAAWTRPADGLAFSLCRAGAAGGIALSLQLRSAACAAVSLGIGAAACAAQAAVAAPDARLRHGLVGALAACAAAGPALPPGAFVPLRWTGQIAAVAAAGERGWAWRCAVAVAMASAVGVTAGTGHGQDVVDEAMLLAIAAVHIAAPCDGDRRAARARMCAALCSSYSATFGDPGHLFPAVVVAVFVAPPPYD